MKTLLPPTRSKYGKKGANRKDDHEFPSDDIVAPPREIQTWTWRLKWVLARDCILALLELVALARDSA